jgi:hypothetical protein
VLAAVMMLAAPGATVAVSSPMHCKSPVETLVATPVDIGGLLETENNWASDVDGSVVVGGADWT